MRFAIVRARARGEDVGELLHVANNLSTAALAWRWLRTDERRSINERIERLIEEWAGRS